MGDLYLRENPVISEPRTEFLLESIIKHQKHSAWRPAPVLTTLPCHLQMGRDVGSWVGQSPILDCFMQKTAIILSDYILHLHLQYRN